MRQQVIDTALDHPEASPRELALQITDTQGYFISESSVYRILKRCDLITSPAYIVLSTRDRFQHPTPARNELWQTDFTYFRVIGWGWYYLSTVLDDYSRFIIAWKLFPTMGTSDVQETLDLALESTGLTQMRVRHRPRLLSDNGPCYLSHDLKEYLRFSVRLERFATTVPSGSRTKLMGAGSPIGHEKPNETDTGAYSYLFSARRRFGEY